MSAELLLIPPHERKFNPIPGDALANDASPPAWLVKGWLPVTSEPVGIYGDSGVGKTTFALDLALAVARGVPFHGAKAKKGRVVWLASENFEGMRTRLRAYRTAHNCDAPVEVVREVPRLDRADDVRQLALDIGMCDAIFVDHLTAVKGAAELNSDMASLMNGAKLLSRLSGASVVIIHHEGKNAANGAKGGSEFRSFAQTLIHIEAASSTSSKVSIVKQRDGAREPDKMWYALKFVELGQDEDGDTYGACVIEPTIKQLGDTKTLEVRGTNQRIALSVVQEKSGALKTEIVAEIMQRADLKNSHANRALADLIAKGAVKLVEGRAWLANDPAADFGVQP